MTKPALPPMPPSHVKGSLDRTNTIRSYRKQGGGRQLKYPSPESLLAVAEDYIKWADKNPIKVQRATTDRGSILRYVEEKRRPLSMNGLCSHMGLGRRAFDTVYLVHKDDSIRETAEFIKNVIATDLIEGGLVDLYNANFAARLTGVGDSVEARLGGLNGAPIPVLTIQPIASGTFLPTEVDDN
nr:terminase small subunit [uncultured Cohaesibacter sp.]